MTRPHPPSALLRPTLASLLLASAWALSACSGGLPLLGGPDPGSSGLTEVMNRPAERNLLNGIRAYDDGQYTEAERHLGDALRLQLVSAKDRSTAYKTLAFIYCSTGRRVDCEKAFRQARLADPAFALTKAEAGHPLWGPVYAESLR
ncbi:TssQ family T6SS-associated lipoprotein [Ideonella livida]|nr:TssQ family T6SS-associated lipoprotein [Ideonella livida]